MTTTTPDLRIRDVAAELTVSTTQVHKLIKSGRLKAIDINDGSGQRAHWRVPRSSLDAFRKEALEASARRFGGDAWASTSGFGGAA